MVQEESIYALIPPVASAKPREPMYHSKFPKDVAPTASTFGLHGTGGPGVKNVGGLVREPEGAHPYKKAHATFGTLNNRPSPNDILRATKPTLPDPKPFVRTKLAPGKPPNPTKEELALAASRLEAAETAPRKNFVQANAIENILSAPKRQGGPVDWRKKPDFGRVPTYLKNIQKEIAEEHEYIRSMQEAQTAAAPPGMHLMPEEEKRELIIALKTKWDAVNTEYQKTSTLSLASLDTIGKVKRKESYEAQLAQIEKDIEKLSKPVIWVHDDGSY